MGTLIICLTFVLEALVAFAEPTSQRNTLLWFDVDAYGLKVTLNDPSAEACSLPKYPSLGRYSHPVAMRYIEDLGLIFGCGGLKYGIGSTRDCYVYDGTSWEPMEPMSLDHNAYKYASFNAYIDGVGWWIGGYSLDWPDYEGMINEVFTPEGEWKTLPMISSPYGERYPRFQCMVQLNKTHTFMSGGLWSNVEYLSDTWILNWETYEWTASTPMMEMRAYHGCTLTPEGEVIVLGGLDGTFERYIRTVSVFNPVTEQWRQEDTILPPYPEAYTGAAVLLNWNEDIIWLEPSTHYIWKRQIDGGWTRLDVTMGGDFDYYYSNVVIVPDDFVKECH